MKQLLLWSSLVFLSLFGDGPVDKAHAEAVGPGQAEFPFKACETAQALAGGTGRVVCADIAALDQTLVYNRFGSFNPYGMIFALRRDLAPLEDGPAKQLSAGICDAETFTDTALDGLSQGNVRLRDCKRPRPLTLRVNVGDTLVVRVTNLLTPPAEYEMGDDPEGVDNVIDFSDDFCNGSVTDDANRSAVHPAVSRGNKKAADHSEVTCPVKKPEAISGPDIDSDWPNTRGLNLVIQGLMPVREDGDATGPDGKGPHPACMGTGSVAPGGEFICTYKVTEEGTFFFASQAAPAGGEGDGGSIVHGLFGAVVAERIGSRAYRSQTGKAVFDTVWPARYTAEDRTELSDGTQHARATQVVEYEMADAGTGVPYLNMHRTIDVPQADFANAKKLEIVHADLNAIIWCDPVTRADECGIPDNTAVTNTTSTVTSDKAASFPAFREFSVFFHDELKTFYTKNFDDLGRFGQLAGVRDGFAINYGASGMGSILLANRKGIGPSADCMECLYEEFFLTSWANGDPALLEWYSDDPSNVHHSYMNDPVVFRNFHAGPKETHVFHLHAHQWFAGNDPNRGTYLDSQTVAPQQGFTYNIYHGGLRGLNGAAKGWWDTQGSGNRNRTVGDSIFHCHLYPHFAQGMWALWRVHDVLEDGTRKLPDGQQSTGLSLTFKETGEHKRQGSVDRVTGAWLASDEATGDGMGTPVPALIPLPGEALPLLPSYDTDAADGKVTAMPGYPFYIPAEPGHRPPQAPLDIAMDLGTRNPTGDHAADEVDGRNVDPAKWLDGGLSRHIVKDGSDRRLGVDEGGTIAKMVAEATGERKVLLAQQLVAKALSFGDMSGHLVNAKIERLENTGTPLERAAMGFHFNGRVYDPAAPNAGADLLTLFDVLGAPVTGQAPVAGSGPQPQTGSYASPVAPKPGMPAPAMGGIVAVNGAPPKPGSPFADPCGAPRDIARLAYPAMPADPFKQDPLVLWGGAPTYAHDLFVTGFRRYEVSAVQLDLIVNKAGWHDPQARINVLSEFSDRYKGGTGLISPFISDRDEPFFFRALSGECIEFRHTNELPKDLELDDFQVRTPTDTIGQHIHLVKFDVTSSDGSGNGWNYEDGTFAPDELMARRCAAVGGTDVNGEALSENSTTAELRCEEDAAKVWRDELSASRDLFQTTVQRWFADPILSPDENGDPRDRTLRTVFTHDHFGPSSIQQHGFYSALLVEPGAKVAADGDPTKLLRETIQVCPARGTVDTGSEDCSIPPPDAASHVPELEMARFGTPALVGPQKRILNTSASTDPFHPDTREFALAVADFALLYDPRDRSSVAELNSAVSAETVEGTAAADLSGKGMVQLFCDLSNRATPRKLNKICGGEFDNTNGLETPIWGAWFQAGAEAWTPAWLAAGRVGHNGHDGVFASIGLITQAEISALRDHLIFYRAAASGRPVPASDSEHALAKPVAAPLRPESITVDHHDPYLINYRMAAIPLRLGDKTAEGGGLDNATGLYLPSGDCAPKAMSVQGDFETATPSEAEASLANGWAGECSIDMQRMGEAGDIAAAFSSKVHGDPETPVLQAYQGERLMFRMIQGAQEVQHMFHIAGQPFRRNIDQAFPTAMIPLDRAFDGGIPMRMDCFDRMKHGRPGEYLEWSDKGPDAFADPAIRAFWEEHEKTIAECDNIEGFTFAQEIGISEHFEMKGTLRSDVATSFEGFIVAKDAGRSPEMPADLFSKETGKKEATTLTIPVSKEYDYAPSRSSDYLYSYGTIDALWNGAWGLIRIYEGTDTVDPASFNAYPGIYGTQVLAGQKLAGLPMADTEEGGGNVEAANGDVIPRIRPRNTSGALTCPLPGPGKTVTLRRAVVAAVEARHVEEWRNGDVPKPFYGPTRYDPDMLVLALITPESLGKSGDEAGWAADWNDITREAVFKAVGTAYPVGPRPFVLRVNAGDCVELRLVNALWADQDGHLRDLLGDAFLPAITGLNADPEPTVKHAADGDTAALRPLEDGGQHGGGLRPSPALALMVGIPSSELIRDIPLGYGYNRRAMPAGTGDLARVSDLISFYAGRFRIDQEALVSAKAPEGPLRDVIQSRLPDLFTPDAVRDTNPLLQAPLPTTNGAVTVSIVVPNPDAYAAGGFVRLAGAPLVLELGLKDASDNESFLMLNGGALTSTLQRTGEDEVFLADLCREDVARQACVDALNTWLAPLREVVEQERDKTLNEVTHWIPYAFGATPIRALSDPVGQEPHGLIGVVDVVPQQWGITKGYEPSGLDDEGRPVQVAQPLQDGGAGLGFDYAVTNPDGTPVTVREFIVFYRDGMNLWDDQSKLEWKLGEDEITARIVPDCMVCDDTYDRGDKGVNYLSPAFATLLSDPVHPRVGDGVVEASEDMNVYIFPPDYVEKGGLVLQTCAGQQVIVRVVHPGGRARQRAFVMNGYSYDDLFPGFGFPRGALLAPGKSLTAWLDPEAQEGHTAYWHDGPTSIRAGGVWGRIEVAEQGGACPF